MGSDGADGRESFALRYRSMSALELLLFEARYDPAEFELDARQAIDQVLAERRAELDAARSEMDQREQPSRELRCLP